MFGVGIVGGGDIYVALLVYCLLLSINLKLGAVLARAYGWCNWPVPSLRLLWPLVTLISIVSAVVLTIGFAWLRPPPILGQVVGMVILVSSVGAVFHFTVGERERRRDFRLRGVLSVAALAVMSIGLSLGFCVLYFIAKYTFLIAVFLLALFSTRFKQEMS